LHGAAVERGREFVHPGGRPVRGVCVVDVCGEEGDGVLLQGGSVEGRGGRLNELSELSESNEVLRSGGLEALEELIFEGQSGIGWGR
jgi:hypothetical protein